jgi:nucleotidyltransferase substrate binding protein (TIGR01987 family)
VEKLDSACKALETLKEIMQAEHSTIQRDAAIQRFEYTSEACWKATQAALWQELKLQMKTPKQTYAKVFEVGWIEEEVCEQLMVTIEDRNLTSHTYHEGVAEKIYHHLSAHIIAFDKLLTSIKLELYKSPVYPR